MGAQVSDDEEDEDEDEDEGEDEEDGEEAKEEEEEEEDETIIHHDAKTNGATQLADSPPVSEDEEETRTRPTNHVRESSVD